MTEQKLFFCSLILSAAREGSFDAVQSSSFRNVEYLSSFEKRQLKAFVYMDLKFSDVTPKRTLLDVPLEDGGSENAKITPIFEPSMI
ncbi:hypothetical protein N6L24_06850 [Cognatishimia sp. SS12]|uniref:hypothetical protein n=1 Tax=Cognatishimia sp. SS12 TaxID=2979465 RepID=UPI00232E0140|nr:hypothetical protein [Cognatishimia sp. SS12]MDC0737991.1 hypothetical protein [Cognatishimia sp. SS12]